jgi:hypothetical protein
VVATPTNWQTHRRPNILEAWIATDGRVLATSRQ